MTARRPIRPYVHLFQLGPHARVGKVRVPPALTVAPCYVYREADAARARHLDEIAEPTVDERDGELVLAAIEGTVERGNILQELCTDAELAVERAPAHTNGFHAGVTLQQAGEALSRGGFIVHVVGDDAAEDDVEHELEALVRHLDLASLEVTLRSIAARDEELPVHAGSAEEILAAAIERGAPEHFAKEAAARAAAIHPELCDSLVLHTARVARGAGRDHVDAARALMAALPSPVDARVRKAVGR